MSRRPDPRPYASPLRRARAAATRRAILSAAESEFGRLGYVATSIAQVARVAGVAPETVYATFGTKVALLSALVDHAIVDDDAPVPLLDRPWVAELASEPDLDRRIAHLAREGAAILARRAGVDEIVVQAAGADPEAAALLASGRRDRWAGQRRLLTLVLGGVDAPDGSSLDRAADALFAIGSPEVYRLLVTVRGWTQAEFGAWYAAAIRTVVVAAMLPSPPLDPEHP